MITEDYVSFETAKLLKERGFNVPCRANYRSCYPHDKVPFYHGLPKDFNGKEYERLNSEWFSAPTIQMVMKWFLQEHNIYVNVVPSVEGCYWTGKWHSYVANLNERDPVGRFIGTFNSCEEAAEEAIKYCLENLI